MIYTFKLQKTKKQIFLDGQKRNSCGKMRLNERYPAKIGIDKPSAALYNTRILFQNGKGAADENRGVVASFYKVLKVTTVRDNKCSRRRELKWVGYRKHLAAKYSTMRL